MSDIVLAERKQNYLARLKRYIKSLDALGRVLTVIGLLPALVDFLARLTGNSLPIPIWAESLWLIIAFGWANFRLFESYSKSDLEIRIRQNSSNLKAGWLNRSDNQLSLNSQITVDASVRVDIFNHNAEPVDAKVFVASVTSNWSRNGRISLNDIKIAVHRSNVAREAMGYNPFNIAGRGITENVIIKTEIAFDVPPQKAFEYLGSLSKLDVEFGFELAGRVTITLPIKYDVISIIDTIEHEIRSEIKHHQNLVSHGLICLKEFWHVDLKKQKVS